MRRLLPTLLALAAAILAVRSAVAAAADPAWLRELNRYRVAAGVGAVTAQPAWRQGLEDHLTYLGKTPRRYRTGPYASAHTENHASPYYTKSGDTEAHSSNLAEGGVANGVQAIDAWLRAPFHLIGMLRAGLRQVELAIDPATSSAALDILQGYDPWTTTQRPILFPGGGMTTNLRTLGPESPDPRETCGWEHRTVGLDLVALLPQAPAHGLTASLRTPAGKAETSANGGLCVVDELTYRSSNAIYGKTGREILGGDHAVVLLPRRPLRKGTYVARISQPGRPDVAWSFTVGDGQGGKGGRGGGPSAARARVPARLDVRRVGVRHGRLQVRGTLTRAADGDRVRISYRAGGHRTAFHTRVRHGRLRTDRRLPRGLRRSGGRVRIHYAGSGAVRPVRVSLRAGRRPPHLRVRRARVRGGELRAHGTVAPGARGRVQLVFTWTDAAGTVEGIAARVRVGRAHHGHRAWRVRVPVPASAHGGGSLRATYAGGHGIAGAQRVQRVAG